MERLQRKFATIHSTLAQQQNNKPGPDTPRMSSLAHLHSGSENISKVSKTHVDKLHASSRCGSRCAQTHAIFCADLSAVHAAACSTAELQSQILHYGIP